MKKNWYSFLSFSCLLLTVFLLASCSNFSKETSSVSEQSSKAFSGTLNTMQVNGVSSRMASSDNSTVYNDTASLNNERKLVKTGTLSFEVENLSETEANVEKWAQGFGGYISNSWSSRTNVSITAKIPATMFDNAMASTGSFGKLTGRSISTDDVSEQYYDLSSRLETRRVLQTKLKNYLVEAENTADLLQIEEQLNSVTTEIESMEGRFRRLSNSIDYCTITVDASLPENTTDEGPDRPQFLSELGKLGTNYLFFLSNSAIILIYLVLLGIPTVLILALLYWLTFGKIGLVRRLFARLSNQKNKKE